MTSVRCVIHYIDEKTAAGQAEIGPSLCDFLVDAHSSILSNFQVIRNMQLGDLGTSRDIHVGVLVDVDRADPMPEREEELIDFVQCLCSRLALAPESIICGGGMPTERPDGDITTQGIDYLDALVGRLQKAVSTNPSLPVSAKSYEARFEVFFAEEAPTGFYLGGWVTNQGSACWNTQVEQEAVQLGVRLLKTGQAVVAELRFPLPLKTVAPGTGCAFELMIPFAFDEFTRCEFGLVIEHEFWFSDIGRRPIAVESKALSQVLTSKAPLQFGVPGVVVVSYCDEETSEQGAIINKDFPLPVKKYRASSISSLNKILMSREGWDVVVIRNDVVPREDAWLERLLLHAYAHSSIAAIGAVIIDEAGLVVDIGGELYSSGYTRSPGFEAKLAASEVVTYRAPPFLPAGAVYLKDRVLSEVGCFQETLHELQVACIEWCYRARSRGFTTMLSHGCRVQVGSAGRATLVEPPVRSFALRRRLMRQMVGLRIEALNE